MHKVLVIDDMSGVRKSICVILSGCGYQIFEACNGDEGVDLLSKEESIALVITDIFMPKKDGIDFMSLAKAHGHNAKFLAITGGGSKIDIEQTVEDASRYADKVLKKPFRREELIDNVKELIG